MARRTGRLLLTWTRRLAPLFVATFGLWLLVSEFRSLSQLSWWYDSTQALLAAGTAADYDLTTLPWQRVHPRVFALSAGQLSIATADEPFGYEAFANVRVNGAHSAGLVIDANVESGGLTVGLQQAGQWIASNSSQGVGHFAEMNSAVLGFHRTLTVMIANKNPAGPSRVTIRSLRLYLRK